MALGHESAGVVTAVGEGVTSIRPGMRVAIECGIPCRNKKSCARCREGRYNLCPSLRFCSSAKTHPHLDGTLQEVMNHPADFLHPLPPNITFEQGALAEPLGVVIHASRRAAGGEGSGVKPGSNVLVFGAGAVGLLACMLARAQGAKRVVCVDIIEARLKFAKEQGFVSIVVNPAAGNRQPAPANQTPAEAMAAMAERAKAGAERILRAAGMKDGEDGFDVVFECTGAEPCIQTAICVRFFSSFRFAIAYEVFGWVTTGSSYRWKGLVSRNGHA